MTPLETFELDLPFIAVIPYRVQADKNLSDAAKLFFGQIVGLSRKFGYIFATDEQLAKMKDEQVRCIKRYLHELEKGGYIRRETFMHFKKNNEGKNHFIKKRKIFVNEAFSNEIPEKTPNPKNDSNKDYERDKNVPSDERDKNVPSDERDKNVPYKKNILIEHKKQQPERAPSAVVVSSSDLDKLDLKDSLRKKILAVYTPEEITRAVDRVLKWTTRDNDSSAIVYALNHQDTWVDRKGAEETIAENMDYLKRNASMDNKIIAGNRITIGERYVEFAGVNENSKAVVFKVDQKDFIKRVSNHYLKLKEKAFKAS